MSLEWLSTNKQQALNTWESAWKLEHTIHVITWNRNIIDTVVETNRHICTIHHFMLTNLAAVRGHLIDDVISLPVPECNMYFILCYSDLHSLLRIL